MDLSRLRLKSFSAGLILLLIFSTHFAGANPAPPAVAAPPPQDPNSQGSAVQEKSNQITEIQIRGNQIVSTNVIVNQMKSRKGAPLVQKDVNDDIKRLYKTGYFQDIRMEVEEVSEGYRLIVWVEEKPVIRKILLDGHSTFKEEDLRKTLKVLEGQILDEKALKDGVEAIRKKYRSKGFKFVEVQSEIEMNSRTKEATLYVHVLEGEKYKIKSVRFEGAKAFKEKKLRKLLKTKKRFGIISGIFNEEKFQKDLDRVQLFYQQEGYLDVKVSPRFDYDNKNRAIHITVLVDEGTRYVTGEVKINGTELFPESEIWQNLEMLPGTTYSQYYLANDMDRIRKYYFERGYVESRIVPNVKMNRETAKVDVTYSIQEGDLFFVNKVVIRGNTKTKDSVIRRELRIRPGDKIDGEKVQKSIQRLENLGYFEETTYDMESSVEGNRKDIVFRVKEKRTGELSFGGGVSSIDRLVGFGELSQKNFDLFNFPRFTGGGQKLSLRARVGTISQNFELSFVEPYLFGKKISAGIDAYNTRRDNRNVDFNEDRIGTGITFAKMFTDAFRIGTGYTMERVTLKDLSEDAAQVVRDSEGKTLLSRFKLFQTWDTRDNVFNPSKGALLSFQQEMVGSFLGGDEDYYNLQANYTQYWTLFKKHVVELKLRLGTADAVGSSETVPVFDRYYAGGLGTVRGYNYRRVSPIEGGDAIGGQTLGIMNLEYTFPLPYLEVLKGAAFVDIGQVNADSYRLGFGDFAISVGPGLKIKTPVGPLAFYYGLPIANKDTKDANGRFEFSLSHGF